MEGIVGGMILCFLFAASTYFLSLYALIVLFKFTRKFYDIFRLLLAAIIAVYMAFSFIPWVMVYIQIFLYLFPVMMFLSVLYLTAVSRTTITKPRNILLLIRFKINSRLGPWVYAIAITVINLLVVFLLTVLLFPV